MRPKILYLTSHHPRGLSSGSQIRSCEICRALCGVGDVHLVTVGAEEHDLVPSADACDLFQELAPVRLAPLPAPTRAGKVTAVLRSSPLYPHGVAAAESDQDRIEVLLRDFDLIWIFKLRTANCFRWQTWPRTVVDIDDVPSMVEQALSTGEGDWKRRLKARCFSAIWRRRERQLPGRFTVMSVCSDEDREHLALNAPVHVIPNGFPVPARQAVRALASPARIGFIGLFDHQPNVEGIRWFLDACWPALLEQMPEMRLRLVGKNGDSVLADGDRNVDALGWVEDPELEIATWSSMMVPVLSGAGTRVKIAEAFSRKCPVVATPLGAYGYAVTDQYDLRLADGAQAFTAACLDLIRDPEKANAMAQRAHTLYLERYSWAAIAPRVQAAARESLRLSERAKP